MNQELPKAYEASGIEAEIYKKWEESGIFNPDYSGSDTGSKAEKAYTITMPPPNVTGILHIGHALFLTIQDILVRYHRMKGEKTLWLPGTDSAAIATLAKVENELYKKEGKTRRDFSREDFVKIVNDFALDSQQTILSQIRRMGSSCDWSRLAYTLDEERVSAVNTAFKRMYEDGLIYRGNRLVNWDPKLQTNVSDDEIEWQEETTNFYYLKYGPFVIGTARPETKFGDKYVVMHPEDARYAEYKHGDKLEVEWINGKITATVIKDESVDMEFGTGVMTITPAHDAVDYEIAQRHKLDIEQVIDLRGILLPIAGEFAGEHIKKARPLIIERLASKGLVEKIDEKYTHRIAKNSRGGGVIEPQIREQWFVDVNKRFTFGKHAFISNRKFSEDGSKELSESQIAGIEYGQEVSLKELMKHVVESGQIEIIPEHFKKIYFHWIDNLKDWCISRQILFGHQVPAWYDEDKKIHLAKEVEILFARHGEFELKEDDLDETIKQSPLTQTGREQIKALGGKIRSKGVKKIIASGLKRSQESAEIIAEAIGFPKEQIEIWPELNEVDLGECNKLNRELHANPWKEAVAKHTGESPKEVEERLSKALSKLREIEDGPVLIMGHNISNLCLQAMMEGKNSESFVEKRGVIGVRDFASVVSYFLMHEPKGELVRDADTLDTWFSSGLWTFSTLGWPNETVDLKRFHPTDVLETGYDILFFWVARMVLMSTYHTAQLPFKTVYLHGLVRDKDRQKMSKSKGNIIDPLGVIETYGTDALRFALIFSTSAGTDIPLAEEKIRGMKHFGNKLWNIARFILSNLETWNEEITPITEADKEILEKLKKTIETTSNNINEFRLHEAAQEIYQFTWYEFADKYIEQSKAQMQNEETASNTKNILMYNLVNILKLLHPFMPFETEYIWSILKERNLVSEKILAGSKWPEM